MWSDNETTVDYLNFGVVADACASLLQQANGKPISVGVSGGWGAGKTSLVKMIEQRLTSASKPGVNSYVVVTFNPWLYQDFEGARNALLQMVGDEVLRLAESSQTLIEKAQRLLRRINLLRLAQLGGEAAVTLYTGVPVGAIGSAVLRVGGLLGIGGGEAPHDKTKAESGAKPKADAKKDAPLLRPDQPMSLPHEIQAFRTALAELLDELKVTLVVFVDDLDRCLPKTAISTLESIRLLLFLPRSAFVIAADTEFIKGAVRVHFENTGITNEVATDYFDKLIQVPLFVPRLGINEARAYLALLLIERAHSDNLLDDTHFENALKVIPDRLKHSWRGDALSVEYLKATVGIDNEPMVALMELADGLAPLLAKASKIKANPRLMKRFLNTVYLRSALAKPQGIEDLDIPSLAKWHLLERASSEMADALAGLVSSATDGRVAVLHQAEESDLAGGAVLPEPFSKDEAFAREWLQLRPKLGETDLRPLLHLSRDTATRDFGSDDMTPEGRLLRDALVATTASNPQLTAAITAAGQFQAGLAMARAWRICAPRRTWRTGDEMVMLIETCKVFPVLGNDAATLLDEAILSKVGPGIVPTLYAQAWARATLDGWEPGVGKPVANAIQQARKQVR